MPEDKTGLRRHLTYANVMATIAVFGVLGGGAYATHTHKMGTQDLQNRAVTAPKIANNAVIPRTIRQNAVRSSELRGNAVQRWHIVDNAIRPRHIEAGAVGQEELAEIIEATNTESIEVGETGSASVQCPVGTRVLSGGGFTSHPGLVMSESRRFGPNGWRVRMENSHAFARNLTVRAYCLTTP